MTTQTAWRLARDTVRAYDPWGQVDSAGHPLWHRDNPSDRLMVAGAVIAAGQLERALLRLAHTLPEGA